MREKHRHSQCIKEALMRAEQACKIKGVRLTPIRKKVLELVWQSHKPIKAYDLLGLLSSGDHVEKPPTVYRALEFLLNNHLIHKIESSSSYIGCEYEHEMRDSNFLICDVCHEVKELYEPRLSRTLLETSKKQGFTACQTNIEIRGTCARCAK